MNAFSGPIKGIPFGMRYVKALCCKGLLICDKRGSFCIPYNELIIPDDTFAELSNLDTANI